MNFRSVYALLVNLLQQKCCIRISILDNNSTINIIVTVSILYCLFFYQDRTTIIVVESVGLVGNQENAAGAAGGLKAVGSFAVNSF